MASLASLRRAEVGRLLGNMYEEHPPQLEQQTVPYHKIIVLRQTRQTFDQAYIRSLSENIRVQGLINPLVVVRYDHERFPAYLEVLNGVWGTNYRFEEFAAAGRATNEFYVLVAGECRYRALGLLGRNVVDVRLGINTDPVIALYIQNAENTYTPPPEHEQAYAYQRLFSVIRQADENFPLAAFARHVRRSPDTVRRALQFCALPDDIQFHVRAGHLRYGIAVQLARLMLHQTPAELSDLARGAIVNRTRVPDFRRLVTGRLQVIATGQGDLLGIFKAEQELEARKAARRRTVDREWGMALDGSLEYLRRISQLVVAGQLGQDSSIYASGSVRKRLTRLIDMLETQLPLLRQAKTVLRKDYERCQDLLPQLRTALEALPPAEQED